MLFVRRGNLRGRLGYVSLLKLRVWLLLRGGGELMHELCRWRLPSQDGISNLHELRRGENQHGHRGNGCDDMLGLRLGDLLGGRDHRVLELRCGEVPGKRWGH